MSFGPITLTEAAVARLRSVLDGAPLDLMAEADVLDARRSDDRLPGSHPTAARYRERADECRAAAADLFAATLGGLHPEIRAVLTAGQP